MTNVQEVIGRASGVWHQLLLAHCFEDPGEACPIAAESTLVNGVGVEERAADP